MSTTTEPEKDQRGIPQKLRNPHFVTQHQRGRTTFFSPGVSPQNSMTSQEYEQSIQRNRKQSDTSRAKLWDSTCKTFLWAIAPFPVSASGACVTRVRVVHCVHGPGSGPCPRKEPEDARGFIESRMVKNPCTTSDNQGCMVFLIDFLLKI